MREESWASSDAIRHTMQSTRGRDTTIELNVRRLVHAEGLRYRVDLAPVPGIRRRADIVFTRAQLAVFLDGCFWHACPIHGTHPKTNAEYWSPKLQGNVVRDRDTDARLRAAGWTVIRFWEHEPSKSIASEIVTVYRSLIS
jgi:DNA mismatch endonuclease (patch repair protein)